LLAATVRTVLLDYWASYTAEGGDVILIFGYFPSICIFLRELLLVGAGAESARWTRLCSTKSASSSLKGGREAQHTNPGKQEAVYEHHNILEY